MSEPIDGVTRLQIINLTSEFHRHSLLINAEKNNNITKEILGKLMQDNVTTLKNLTEGDTYQYGFSDGSQRNSFKKILKMSTHSASKHSKHSKISKRSD